MTARAVALFLEDRLATHGVAPARQGGIEFPHRPDISHQSREVRCGVPAWRHGGPGNARLDQAVEIGIRRHAAELAAPQIDAGDRITIGAVTGDAVRVVEVETGLDIRLRVLP